MDKAAILSWLSEIHRRNVNLHLTLPDAPNIGHFIQNSNESRLNDACYQEIVALGNASGLKFPDYFNGVRPPSCRPWNRAEHAAMVRRHDGLARARNTTSPTSKQDSTCESFSSQGSCPGYNGVSKTDSWGDYSVLLHRHWRICIIQDIYEFISDTVGS